MAPSYQIPASADSPSDPAPPVVSILHLSGEGGGYHIKGQQLPSGWQFRVHSHSIFDDEFDEDEPVDPPWLRSLDMALSRLNPSWPRLHPGNLHPDFALAIGERVRAFHARSPLRASELKSWQAVGAISS